MKILSIETSCDETAISIVEASGGLEKPQFSVLGNALYSQADIHAEYGGVFPTLAKREHQKNLIPLLQKVVDQVFKNQEAKSKDRESKKFPESTIKHLQMLLEREPKMCKQFLEILPTIPKPDIDLITVTQGPGLEPALWVGINFAKALSFIWNIPVVPTNHMEGHIYSALYSQEKKTTISFPAVALLVSGGHTQLISISDWGNHTILGETLDDAVGEAYDKVARMLKLPYPGGPYISKHAESAREKEENKNKFNLPRPMLSSDDFNFSFSGLKTAVLYAIKKHIAGESDQNSWSSDDLPELSQDDKEELAREFEDAVMDVLVQKTQKAIEQEKAQCLIVGGGVIANKYLRERLQKIAKEYSIPLLLPSQELSTDNAIMIGIAGYIKYILSPDTKNAQDFRALGNLRVE